MGRWGIFGRGHLARAGRGRLRQIKPTAVLEALGKRRGPADMRPAAQRFHDALQEGCTLLPRVCLLLDRAACRMVRTFAGQPKSSWRTATDLGGMSSSGKNSAHI
jgi:hypothetical protein